MNRALIIAGGNAQFEPADFLEIHRKLLLMFFIQTADNNKQSVCILTKTAVSRASIVLSV
jgi:hypothetical protein